MSENVGYFSDRYVSQLKSFIVATLYHNSRYYHISPKFKNKQKSYPLNSTKSCPSQPIIIQFLDTAWEWSKLGLVSAWSRRCWSEWPLEVASTWIILRMRVSASCLLFLFWNERYRKILSVLFFSPIHLNGWCMRSTRCFLTKRLGNLFSRAGSSCTVLQAMVTWSSERLAPRSLVQRLTKTYCFECCLGCCVFLSGAHWLWCHRAQFGPVWSTAVIFWYSR